MTKNQLFSSLLLFILVCAAISSQAQQRSCSTMDVLERQLESNPDLANKIQSIENHTQRVIQNTNGNYQRIDGIITIPVVIHIIYQTDEQNISEAQVLSQMQVLNDDFRRNNANADNMWPQAADTEIEFCLATVDPNGNPTTGINRKFYDRDEWGFDDAMKYAANGGVDAWPVSEYLNIWVCYLGRAYLGYAQFPGGDPATDGIVMSPQFFGSIGTAQAPYDGGRTATHEIGHWLNLRHIWGDGDCSADDFVSDTPISDSQNYGCDIGHVSCNTIDMVQNYMDYSDDDCMNLFTQGQKDRMRAMFDVGGFRSSLLNSMACNGVAASCNDGIQNQGETGIDCGEPCAPCSTICLGNQVTLSITFDDFPEDISWVINNNAGSTLLFGGNYYNEQSGSTLIVNQCLPNGCYDFIIFDSYGDGICCDFGNGSYTLTAGGNTIVSSSSFDSSEATYFCVSSATPTCNDGIQNQGETGIDCGGPCAPCSSSCSELTFSITFDDYPKDTSWEITNSFGSTVASGDNYDDEPDRSTLTVTECLPNGCYDFTIYDDFGDGICCRYGNGSYSLTSGGSTLASGNSFDDSETTNFCLSGTTPTCDDGIQNQGETGIDCGGPCRTCSSSCSELTFSITFDDYPKDTSWEITNSSGSTVASGDNYDDEPDRSTLTVTECLPNGCYDFTIYDDFGDGICCRYGNGSYSLTSGGSTLASGSSFDYSETSNFCVSAVTPTCNDGIQNQGETGIDCGGPCTPCSSSCSELTFNITFDDYPKDTSWEIINSAGSTVASGDNYDDEPDRSTLTVTECLPNGCYDFTIYDSFNDGLCCRYGNGSYSLTGGGSTLASGSDFDGSETTNFCLSAATSTNNNKAQNQGENEFELSTKNPVNFSSKNGFELQVSNYIEVYPNPAVKQAKIELNLTNSATNVNLYIVDISGKMVYTQTVKPNNQKQILNINVESFPTGVYMINVVSDQQRFTKKLTVLD